MRLRDASPTEQALATALLANVILEGGQEGCCCSPDVSMALGWHDGRLFVTSTLHHDYWCPLLRQG
jgi:hypothetical protein